MVGDSRPPRQKIKSVLTGADNGNVNSATWYWTAAPSATACSLFAIAVVVVGWKRHLAEVAILGSALLVVSVLPLTHALGGTRLVDGPPGSGWAAAIALPGAAIASLPLFGPPELLERWKWWIVTIGVLVTVAALALVSGTTSPPPVVTAVLLAVGVAGAAALVRRQWTLYRIGRLRSSLVAVIAIGSIAIATVTAVITSPGSTLSWFALGVENAGVGSAGVAILLGYRVKRNVVDVLAPIAARDPLVALEVGLSPEVHAFVAALERKDPITRDHVVRTSSLALQVALRAGLDRRTSRDVALGALLHDIGKLVVPSDILNKASALTDDEFQTIKTHPEAGERLLEGAPSLAAAARFVRWHHERYDGRGYPDRIAGHDLPFDVGIVSAADAWDAMTNTRQYRTAMSAADAAQILSDGAGTQWHPDAVRLLLAEVKGGAGAPEPAARPTIGRDLAVEACPCLSDVLLDVMHAADTPREAGAPSAAGEAVDGCDELINART